MVQGWKERLSRGEREVAVEVVRSSQMLDVTYFEVRVLPLGLDEKRFEGFWLEHPEGCKS